MTLQPVAHDVPRGLTTLSKPIPRGTGEHVARLIRWFESTFDCRDGLKRAWTYVPATTAEAHRIEALMKTEGRFFSEPGAWTLADKAFNAEFNSRVHAEYHIIGYGCEGGPEQEERLCNAVKSAAYTLLGDPLNLRPELYWRRKPVCEFEPASTRNFETQVNEYVPAKAWITVRIAVPSRTERLVQIANPMGCPVAVLKP